MNERPVKPGIDDGEGGFDLRAVLQRAADGTVPPGLAERSWTEAGRVRNRQRAGVAGLLAAAVIGIAVLVNGGLLGLDDAAPTDAQPTPSTGQVATGIPAATETYVFHRDAPEPSGPAPTGVDVDAATPATPDQLIGTSWELRSSMSDPDGSAGALTGPEAPQTTLAFTEQAWGLSIADCGAASSQGPVVLAADGSFAAAGWGTEDQGCADDAQAAEDYWIDALQGGGWIRLVGDDVLLLSVRAAPDEPVPPTEGTSGPTPTTEGTSGPTPTTEGTSGPTPTTEGTTEPTPTTEGTTEPTATDGTTEPTTTDGTTEPTTTEGTTEPTPTTEGTQEPTGSVGSTPAPVSDGTTPTVLAEGVSAVLPEGWAAQYLEPGPGTQGPFLCVGDASAPASDTECSVTFLFGRDGAPAPLGEEQVCEEVPATVDGRPATWSWFDDDCVDGEGRQFWWVPDEGLSIDASQADTVGPVVYSLDLDAETPRLRVVTAVVTSIDGETVEIEHAEGLGDGSGPRRTGRTESFELVEGSRCWVKVDDVDPWLDQVAACTDFVTWEGEQDFDYPVVLLVDAEGRIVSIQASDLA